MVRQRYWCFTYNNYDAEFFDFARDVLAVECNFLGFQPERGSENTRHIQGFLCFRNPRELAGISRLFDGRRPHLEPMRGSVEQSIAYCSKDDTRDAEAPFGYTQYGTQPRPGAGAGSGSRSDLSELCGSIKSGDSITRISEQYPAQYIQYHGGIKALYARAQAPRNFVTEVLWYYGPTGSGKTRCAFDAHPTAYFKPPTNKWWDGYENNECVIIDDYRCDFSTFADLLRLFDRYPLQVEYKGGFTQFNSKVIIITTPRSPQMTWANRTDEQMQQLLRRITEVKRFGPEEEPSNLAPCFVPTKSIAEGV